VTIDPVLRADGIVVRFGGLTAVDGVSVDLHPGRITGLMGPNGAGKSTFFNAVSGHQALTAGHVELGGRDVTSLSAHRRARLGISRTFQLGGLVDDLTAVENIALGIDHAGRMSGRAARRGEVRRAAHEVLERFGLTEVTGSLGEDLGAGLRRRVEVARAMAAKPAVLLLDEPAAGLTIVERDDLAELIRRVADDGTAVLVTEHASDFLFTISHEIVVMNFGKELRRGGPAEIKNDSDVVSAYLG
jgi:ABC-type branched-subunit amino acid transport system ATPase component